MTAAVDSQRILAALHATGWNVTQAAALVGLQPNNLHYHMRRLGITRPNKVSVRAERHPPTAAVVAEMEQLRTQVRLILRRPGPRHVQELLLIESRHRVLRDQLRAAMGEAEATETRERSPAVVGRAGGPLSAWAGQR